MKEFLCKINIACMKGRTTLVITHRLPTILNATKIIIIDQGTVIEQGKRNQLFFV
jgi:ABC-type transport system involved in Fe-S cluster assembly fused permease/ATPase subunit